MSALQPIDYRISHAMLEIVDFVTTLQHAFILLRLEQIERLAAENSEAAKTELVKIEKSDNEIYEKHSKMMEALKIVVSATGPSNG